MGNIFEKQSDTSYNTKWTPCNKELITSRCPETTTRAKTTSTTSRTVF